jgi:hypothetical protein
MNSCQQPSANKIIERKYIIRIILEIVEISVDKEEEKVEKGAGKVFAASV